AVLEGHGQPVGDRVQNLRLRGADIAQSPGLLGGRFAGEAGYARRKADRQTRSERGRLQRGRGMPHDVAPSRLAGDGIPLSGSHFVVLSYRGLVRLMEGYYRYDYKAQSEIDSGKVPEFSEIMASQRRSMPYYRYRNG